MADDPGPASSLRPDRARVEALAGFGLSVADIARVFDVEPAVLERDYRNELAGGQIKANARVAESLYRKAIGEGRESVTAAIFWLKTRARWKETSVHELAGSGDTDVTFKVIYEAQEFTRRIETMAGRLKPGE